MSDTPRTDSFIQAQDGKTWDACFCATADFARTLECELADWKEKAERYRLHTLKQDIEILELRTRKDIA